MICGARSVAGLAPLLGVGSWNLVLPDGGEWKHVAVVPYRLVASSVSLSKKRVSRSDAANSKCFKHATGVIRFVQSAKRNCKVGLTEVQCGEIEKCVGGRAEQNGGSNGSY